VNGWNAAGSYVQGNGGYAPGWAKAMRLIGSVLHTVQARPAPRLSLRLCCCFGWLSALILAVCTCVCDVWCAGFGVRLHPEALGHQKHRRLFGGRWTRRDRVLPRRKALQSKECTALLSLLALSALCSYPELPCAARVALYSPLSSSLCVVCGVVLQVTGLSDAIFYKERLHFVRTCPPPPPLLPCPPLCLLLLTDGCVCVARGVG
jgi:hypothetical protein